MNEASISRDSPYQSGWLSPDEAEELKNSLRETQIQLQKLRAAAWGAADIFRREAEDDCGNGRFIATPIMVEFLWGELNGIPEDLDLLRWARDNELADLREENERLLAFVKKIRATAHAGSLSSVGIALTEYDLAIREGGQ